MVFNIAYPTPVLFGDDTSSETGKKLKEYGVKKVLCIYDRGVKAAGVVERIINTLLDEEIAVVEFDGVLPDPPASVIDEAGELGRQERVDAVLGIGGGSSLDAAKAINVLLGNPGSIANYFDMNVPQNPGKPLFLIPTTSGTGSEVTSVAVVTDTGTGKKLGVIGKNCTATLAIVDPMLTLRLNPELTAATGLDTLAHAVEAVTSALNNPMSDVLALEAITLVAKYLPLAVKEGGNKEARFFMSFASTLAGMAFSSAFPHLGHAIGHILGAKYHIPHGTACGVALPGVVEYVADVLPDKVDKIGRAMGLSTQGLSVNARGEAVADEIRRLNREIGLSTLRKLNIPESALLEIAEEALQDVCAYSIPKKTTPQDVLELLEKEYRAGER